MGRFGFQGRVEFTPESAAEALREVPAAPGVFALRGEDAGTEPYLTRAADVRRRVARLLAPPETGADGQVVRSRRLNLRERVRSIEWTVTGSEFESLLLLYDASRAEFGQADARRRMRLYPPYFVRFTAEHEHPRLYVTNRLAGGRGGQRRLGEMYGPFASRMAAERYCDGVLDLFRLRRCWEDLEVSPEHPGCAYGEMKRCMAPCNQTCTAEEYRAEAERVRAFLETRGESLLREIAAERERASETMEFEAAAAAHERYGKIKAVAGLADELVRPVTQLRAVVVQQAAPRVGGKDQAAEGLLPTHREVRDAWGTGDSGAGLNDPRSAGERLEAAVFLLEGGCVVGPERLSTLGVRAVKEQTSVGSSLFAQPLMLEAVPLEGAAAEVESPEARAAGVLQRLETRAGESHGAEMKRGGLEVAALGDHLALFRRWYYRPEKQRAGEVFLLGVDGGWPVRRILRGAARMALGEPKAMAETNREGAAAAKMKILHEGREGVERAVPVGKRGRRKTQKSPF